MRTVEDLIMELMPYKDYEVRFSYLGKDESSYGVVLNVLKRFINISVGDVGHSDKVVYLAGDNDDK